MPVTPPTSRLNFTVAITQDAATSLGSSTTLPVTMYLADSPIGFQWQVAIYTMTGWNLISTGVHTGRVYDDGEVSSICTEINSMGLVSWIMREAKTWFDALMVAFFTGKIAGSAPPVPPSGEVTPINFQAQVNGTLATMGARDTNGDGIPELVMA